MVLMTTFRNYRPHPPAAHNCHLNDKKNTAEYTLLNDALLFVNVFSMSNS